MTGYIPPTITFISRKPETIVNEWEDGGEINSFEASPTYVATNEKTVESGKSWARGWRDRAKTTVTPANNNPFKGLRITSYEHRSEGGGAFKAIADGQWYVDLRTDTLLDILVNHSVKNGEVQGAEFIWARVGSQAKVVRVGSSLYAKLVESTALDKVKPPKASDLQPGDVYEAKTGQKAVFMGWCSTIQMTEGNHYANELPALTRVPKIQCWCRGDSVRFEAYTFEFKKSTSYRTKVGHKPVPSSWPEKVRAATAKWMADPGRAFYLDKPNYLAEYCSTLHVGAVGESVALSPHYDRYKHLFK